MTTKGLSSRQIAHAVLMRIFKQQQTLEQAMAGESLALGGLSAPDRGFVYQLAMTVLRHHSACAAMLARYLQQPLKPSRLDITLCLYLGIVQLCVLKSPAHAAVDTSVELAKTLHSPLSGLVNAVLKKVAKDDSAFAPSPPQWMYEGWLKGYGEAAANAIAAAHLGERPLDITVKDATQLEHWREALNAELLPTGSLRLHEASDITQLAGFNEGAWWVQEVAASLPVKMMGNLRGKKVLDICAAPGGKTMQLIAAGAEVTALDISGKRLEKLRENLARMQMQATLIEADVMKWEAPHRYDAILLDAPCTATGTLRRHPEIALLRSPQDKDRLVQTQARMLRRALDWLTPEGVFVYAVCSLQPEEGEAQIAALLAEGEARLQPITHAPAEWLTPEGMLRTLPSYLPKQGGMDGFFAACLTANK